MLTPEQLKQIEDNYAKVAESNCIFYAALLSHIKEQEAIIKRLQDGAAKLIMDECEACAAVASKIYSIFIVQPQVQASEYKGLGEEYEDFETVERRMAAGLVANIIANRIIGRNVERTKQ